MGLFMMLSGHILAWNLLLCMDVSFSLWYIEYDDKQHALKFPQVDMCAEDQLT